jgi:hypothetical protein
MGQLVVAADIEPRCGEDASVCVGGDESAPHAVVPQPTRASGHSDLRR